MLASCLFCHRPLPGNDVLECFPFGRRVAYDPERGRLWAVCGTCARWNLAPIEERWEALEELERLTRDRGRLLSRTDNIALLRAPGLEIVKVGNAELREEAWWRYGTEMQRRHRRSRVLGLVDFGTAVTVGFWGFSALAREAAFTDAGWRGTKLCDRCGAPVVKGSLSPHAAGRLFLAPTDDGGFVLTAECPRCGWRRERGFAIWTGGEARAILRTTMAYQNFTGAGSVQVDAATRRIVASGGPAGFVGDVARGRGQLLEFKDERYRISGLALEIALSEELERRLLQQEVSSLEAEWRTAEQIAAIVDRELTPLPPFA